MPMPALATAIQKAAIRPRYRAAVTGHAPLAGWLVHSGSAFKVESSYNFTALYFNATTLILRGSIAAVEANAESWFQDTDGTVYVRPPASTDIYSSALRGEILFYFSKEGFVLDDQYYDGRLLTVPALSLRIEARFSGVGQIGSGSCTFANADGFFDARADIRWSSVQFSVGADLPASAAASSDYEPFGYWKIQDTRRNGTEFVMNLVEPKNVLQNKIPFETFTQSDYPLINSNDIGKPIPRVYGKVFGITPVCVDTGAKRFKVAGHAIYEFSEVRILQNNVWVGIPFASIATADAEFTLGAEWANNETVSVDFVGRMRGDGKPMYNASEIVQDILQYLGESDFNTTAFDDAFDALDVGSFPNGVRRTICKPSLYIGSATPAIDIVSKINNVAGSYLFFDANGQWFFGVFTPKRLQDLGAYSFSDQNIFSGFTEAVDEKDIASKVNVKFAERVAEKWAQNVIEERESTQFRAESPTPILKEVTAPLFDAVDAAYYAQRLLNTDGLPLKRYTFAVSWAGILLKPGDQIPVSFDRNQVYGVFEVIEARHDLDANRINLVCGDRRAWGDSFGWWVDDSFAAWDASGSAAEKREASENAGFWHGDDDLADSTDSASHKASRYY